MTDVEALCRSFLLNAAARRSVLARVEPEERSADYRIGFGAGWEAGQVAGLALAVGVISGQSPTAVLEDADSQAAMDSAFPFEIHVEAS